MCAGSFESLASARRYVAEHVEVREYEPKPTASWDRLRHRYAALEEQAVSVSG